MHTHNVSKYAYKCKRYQGVYNVRLIAELGRCIHVSSLPFSTSFFVKEKLWKIRKYSKAKTCKMSTMKMRVKIRSKHSSFFTMISFLALYSIVCFEEDKDEERKFNVLHYALPSSLPNAFSNAKEHARSMLPPSPHVYT